MNKKAMKLTVIINQTDPVVKREVVIHPDASLHELHKLIQSSMPWTNCHLHLFQLDEQIFSYPGFLDEDSISTIDFKVSQALLHIGDEIHYVYDFGDNWTHTITLNGFIKLDENITCPYVESGINACPPEDCGGVQGFENLKEQISRLESNEDKELSEWANNTSNTTNPYIPDEYDPFTHAKPLYLYDHERYAE